MGLDNGIFKINRQDLPLKIDDANIYGYIHTEVCYWRKCWHFRDSLISRASIEDHRLGNSGYYEIDDENIDMVIETLTYCILEAIEDEDDDWEDSDWNRINLANLLLIKEDIISPNPKYRYFFYDSY